MAAVIALIAYSDRCTACDGGFEIILKFLENELVDLLNLQMSEITEILERLTKQGLIKMDRNRIVLKNRDILDHMAEKVFQAKTAEVVI